ncbi:sulfite exporter TauE/SafE family protein [Zooshikella sp. WH53]|uniref:Probable membrane transporter protein n=2 Tax=Zooshikella harenae TaxID=2827238 RepID=A0ABS5ZGD5_9GAMM|nr:sulfite exporter TauE/SafE family protein [Zooshikella harenae]
MLFDIQYSTVLVGALIGAGFFAGFINTIAGGGSMLTLPALMLLGIPADVANATNRVSVFLQCLTGMKGFHSHNQLDIPAIKSIVTPTLLGSLLGALSAAWLPNALLKPVLLVTMISIAFLMLVKPALIQSKSENTVLNVTQHKLSWWALFATGAYGGFIQAGVGFLLIAALSGVLRYDLVRANALKLACTASFTLVALVVFIIHDLVLWVPGLLVAIGSMAGAYVSVKFAVSVPQAILRWLLLILVLIFCIAAWLR